MRILKARDRYVSKFDVVPGKDYRYICPLCGGGIDWPREPMDKNSGGEWCHDRCLYGKEDYGYPIE